MENNILPIGSVVSLQRSKDELFMIVSRGALYSEDNSTEIDGFFDYCAVFYPQGLQTTDDLVFFNHENIETIYDLGYKNKAEIEFENNYQEIAEKSDYKKLSL